MSENNGVLAGQVALVTGSAQGMGVAIAARLAREGASLVVSDIDGKKVQRVAEKLRASYGSATAVRTDVTREDEVASMVDTAVAEYGTVSVLVNNAGVLSGTRIDDITTEEWKWVLDVNLNGTFFCSRAVLPVMKKKGFGRIINMSSSAGRSVSTIGGAHYTTAKAAVLGLTRAMAKEVAPFGITVNAICPGLIDTEMVRTNCSPDEIRGYEESFPVPRMGTPEEVAELALYLAAHAPYTTGASLDINGGDLML